MRHNIAKITKIYFEINEKYDAEIIAVFEKMGYKNCKVIKDINEKNRMLVIYDLNNKQM